MGIKGEDAMMNTTTDYDPATLRADVRHHDDRGVTLIELMMVIAISSVIGVMLLSSFVIVSNITVRMAERAEDAIEAKMTTDEITTTLRAATLDPASPDQGVFAVAKPNEIKFLTRAGQGYSEPPRWVHYLVQNRTIYRVAPDGKRHEMMTGLEPILPFRFFRYDPEHGKNAYGNCYLSLDNQDLAKPEMRSMIAGMQVEIYRKARDNVREHNYSQSGEFVRIMEQAMPEHHVTGEQLHAWRNTCWETQHMRTKPAAGGNP